MSLRCCFAKERFRHGKDRPVQDADQHDRESPHHAISVDALVETESALAARISPPLRLRTTIRNVHRPSQQKGGSGERPNDLDSELNG